MLLVKIPQIPEPEKVLGSGYDDSWQDGPGKVHNSPEQRWGKKLSTDQYCNVKSISQPSLVWRQLYWPKLVKQTYRKIMNWINKFIWLVFLTKKSLRLTRNALLQRWREIAWACSRITLNFFAFLAAKCYITRGNWWRCFSGTYPTAWAWTRLGLAFCVMRLPLKMQSLDSVSVISRARISLRREVTGLFN